MGLFFSGQHYLNEGGNQGLQMVPYLARLAADAGDMTLGVGLLLLPCTTPSTPRKPSPPWT
jgi:hypothetical protein